MSRRTMAVAAIRLDVALMGRLAVQLDARDTFAPEDKARAADHLSKMKDDMRGAIERARVQLTVLDGALNAD